MEKSNEIDLKLSLNSNEWQKYLDKHYKNNSKGETIKDVKISNIPKENTTINKSQKKKHTHPFIIILLLILVTAFVVNAFVIYDLKQQIDGLREWIDSIDNRTSWGLSWEKYRNQQETKKQQGNSNYNSQMVWIGDTGTKYHKQSCRTLKGNGHQITMEQALAEGREPCKVCY